MTTPAIVAEWNACNDLQDRLYISHIQVDLAVKFLNNPRVQGSPMDQKMAFLRKKGKFISCIIKYKKVLSCSQALSPPVKFSLDPPKIGSPRNKFFGPTLKNLFPL